MLSLELYDRYMGCFHGDTPISLATHNIDETVYPSPYMKARIHQLLKLKIPECAQMSLMELLELPTDILLTIIESCSQRAKENTAIVNKLTHELEKNSDV